MTTKEEQLRDIISNYVDFGESSTDDNDFITELMKFIQKTNQEAEEELLKKVGWAIIFRPQTIRKWIKEYEKLSTPSKEGK